MAKDKSAGRSVEGYAHTGKPGESVVEVKADGPVADAPAELAKRMKVAFDTALERKAAVMVIHYMTEGGDVVTACAGSPADVMHVDEVGFHQLIDMVRRAGAAAAPGRNG